MHSRDILRKNKRDHLDPVHSDQMVLETVRQGRLVLFIGSQEHKEDYQAPVHSDQIVSHDSHTGGWCERRLTQGLHPLRMLK